MDVESTCVIANVRIHVERVIGLLRRNIPYWKDHYQQKFCLVILMDQLNARYHLLTGS